MRIVAVGPLWRGSNAGGLFRAFSRQKHIVDIVDEFYYISLRSTNKITKILERVIRPRQVDNYNEVIINAINTLLPDILFVYKGAFVKPATLKYAKQKGCRLALFYPDVSLTFHGSYIPLCIPLYEKIFTTKTFGVADIKSKFGITSAAFIPHGFDPEIHRKLDISPRDREFFGCDTSFIGTWSPKKERMISYLKDKCPDIKLNIWGDQWSKSTAANLKSSIRYQPVLGDLYAIAIQCSAINLGILSEVVSGSSSGDLITSRTFHIPGASGFLLHERNEESVLYFKENEEAAFFDGEEELVEKVHMYLADPGLRQRVAEAGYLRALRDHSLDSRAEVVTRLMEEAFTLQGT